jgi:transcriptional regulator with XRE-family HTH domain
MEWKNAKQRLLKDEKIRKAYKKVDLAYEIGNMIVEARAAKNITQAQLAKMVGTKQPSIARLEAGARLPSLSFLEKVAQAFGTQLLPPRLEFLENQQTYTTEPIKVSDYRWNYVASLEFGSIGITTVVKERRNYAYA